MRAVIDELLSMAQYYGVNWKQAQEYWLLSFVKEAILAPVLHPWRGTEDEDGHPIFLHTRHAPPVTCWWPRRKWIERLRKRATTPGAPHLVCHACSAKVAGINGLPLEDVAGRTC